MRSHKLEDSVGRIGFADSLGFREADLFPPCPSLTPELRPRQPRPRGQWVTQMLPVFLATVTRGMETARAGVHGLSKGPWREDEAELQGQPALRCRRSKLHRVVFWPW